MLNTQQIKFLNAHFSNIAYNAMLKNYSHFRIGGPAHAIIFPESFYHLALLLPWLTSEKIPWLVIGNGSNILFDDSGFCGIIINLTQCCSIQIRDRKIRADAGISLKRLWLHATRHSLGGMNFALGIPGTLGGAVRMNAGAGGGQMADVLESIVCIATDGQQHCIEKNALKIGYRSISWDSHISDAIVVQANLVLKPEHKHSIRQDARQRLKYRKSTQPIGCACAGSFFKNPSSELSAGYLIEQAGLKGYRIGHAAVSSRHANFIINLGQATSQEIEDLMHFIQEKVFMQFNVQLQPEVQIIHV